MNKKRHSTGGNIRCPYCKSSNPRKLSRIYNIKSNYLRRNYMCLKCIRKFTTIELQITEGDLIERLTKKHKPATTFTVLHDLYFNDFDKFLEQYIQTDDFFNYQDFISKVSKVIGRIDKYLYMTSDKLLPEDIEIIFFEDKFLHGGLK